MEFLHSSSLISSQRRNKERKIAPLIAVVSDCRGDQINSCRIRPSPGPPLAINTIRLRNQVPAKNTGTVHHQVIGEKYCPAPGGEIAHHGVGQGAGTESGRSERVPQHADDESHDGRGTRPAPDRKTSNASRRKSGADSGWPNLGRNVKCSRSRRPSASSSRLRSERRMITGANPDETRERPIPDRVCAG